MVTADSCRESSEPLALVRGPADYMQSLHLQRQYAAGREIGGNDVLILVQHDSVYTAGSGTQPADRPKDGTSVIDVDRGGRINWHGPGQLTGYVIVKLNRVDVPDLVRRLEQGLIAVCDELGIVGAGRISGRSGVWLPGGGRVERKIAAIGLRIRRAVTMHGFQINCNPDSGVWDRIVPCGIPDAGVTSLSEELSREVRVEDIEPLVARSIAAALDGHLPVRDRDLGGNPALR